MVAGWLSSGGGDTAQLQSVLASARGRIQSDACQAGRAGNVAPSPHPTVS